MRLTLVALKWSGGEPNTNLDLWSLRFNHSHNYSFGTLNPFISAAVRNFRPGSRSDALKDLTREVEMQPGVASLKMAPNPPSTIVSI
jgi:hypothetical protein